MQSIFHLLNTLESCKRLSSLWGTAARCTKRGARDSALTCIPQRHTESAS